eukprot:364759-Chlamydomonas_euryale.AAC.17
MQRAIETTHFCVHLIGRTAAMCAVVQRSDLHPPRIQAAPSMLSTPVHVRDHLPGPMGDTCALVGPEKGLMLMCQGAGLRDMSRVIGCPSAATMLPPTFTCWHFGVIVSVHGAPDMLASGWEAPLLPLLLYSKHTLRGGITGNSQHLNVVQFKCNSNLGTSLSDFRLFVGDEHAIDTPSKLSRGVQPAEDATTGLLIDQFRGDCKYVYPTGSCTHSFFVGRPAELAETYTHDLQPHVHA